MFLQSLNYSCLFDRNFNNFVAIRAYVLQTLVSWAAKFLATFPADSYMKNSHTKNESCGTLHLSRDMPLRPWSEMHLTATTRIMHSARLLLSTAKVTFPSENDATELTWRRIRRNLWSLYSPDWTPSESYLWERLKRYAYTSHQYTMEELRHYIRREISIIPGELQTVNHSHALVMSAFDQEATFSVSISALKFSVSPCEGYHHNEISCPFIRPLLRLPTHVFDVTLAECPAGS
jgi:hypothetical protein